VGICPWNGLPLVEGQEVSPVALAVQIENHPLARPARNLSAADMVVEATVEGDVTRFTAIFQCRPTLGRTGPVRSARYYSLDLWRDLHVLPYFFGAGSEAVRRFRAAGMPFVNGIWGTWPGAWFGRYGTAPAPHNLYADVEATRSAFGSYAALDALTPSVGSPRPQFAFDEAVVLPAGRPVGSVEIRPNSYWRVGWTWDATAGAWLRSDAGQPIIDAATGERLQTRTVVVQKVIETIENEFHDPGGSPRRVHQLVGSGSGVLYVDGRAFDVRWSRPTAADGTRWTYADTGATVVLPPGVLWWEIMPTYATIVEG